MIRRELPELGPVFYLDTWPFGPQMLAANSLETLRQITQDHSLPKYPALKSFLQPIADGQDIVTMEGAVWKKWRTIFNPGFSMAHLLTLASGIVEETLVFCDLLQQLSQTGEVFSMKPYTDYLTLDVIGSIVLGVRLRSQTRSNALAEGLRSQIPWLMFGGDVNPLQRWNPLRPIVLWYNKRRMDNFIKPYLEGRIRDQQDQGKPTTIIDLALKAYLSSQTDSPGVKEVDATFKNFALSQIKLFLFSGHDTTSSSICYLLYILANHHDVREHMRKEHDSLFGSNLHDTADSIKNNPSILNRLPYTTAVIKETLRLYLAVSSTRIGEPDFDVIDESGRKFPTDGFMVWANSHTIQRDPKYWPKADEFLPERWLVSSEDPLHPIKGAWRPFEYGPRNCTGQELAIMEMKIILVMTIRRFEILTAYDQIDVQTSSKASKHVYNERGYQITRAQPSCDLPC